MNTAVMFSRQSDEWSTPAEVWEPLHREFGFQVDAAATAHNALCALWFGLDAVPGGLAYDALAVDWTAHGRVFWLNPPYSRVKQFMAKAAGEAQKGCTVVCLVPARTDTWWFHVLVWDSETHQPRPGVEVRFIRGRLKFGGSKNSAPFPSCVVIFRPPA